ncbi:cytochrome c3 family protein [Geoalkalibacter halelectricus]|uniref:Cytochrome c3 family protein n=1 Tax=Geoalkalibacter halelectricus TaxID=2847045 RepID=A0ABY5ZP02_9BACT|nr:cytochrome c3 family protein [Geoalkalibacter halelectricus]MDO3377355.1 cytochrome c3 family protein [Geoalkalibacter halelectricus]UWZ80880.1 cytochrome c3 family protein [Geoalkalibacter halelectricus]
MKLPTILTQTFILVVSLVASAWASTPQLPVNQFIGMPDTLMVNMQEADCRICHGENPPPGMPVGHILLVERHHNLDSSTIPEGTAAPNGEPGKVYTCFSCHDTNYGGQGPPVWVNRNCVSCHSGPSPHHTTTQAQGGDCQSCHGSLVENGLLAENREVRNGAPVPTWLPSYPPSLITPWPSRKPNSGAQGEGNCTYCHAPSLAKATGLGAGYEVDPVSGIKVYNMADTHHIPGLVHADNCVWCHLNDGATTGLPSAGSIRTCQNCHSIASLHNIQYDNQNPDTPNILPGRMDAGFGHIGSSNDCNGCHGFLSHQAIAPLAGPLVPYLDGASANVVTAGSETELVLHGTNFTNQYAPVAGLAGVEYLSDVILVDAHGAIFELDPSAISATRISVILPDHLPAGNYLLRVRKLDKLSNPEPLVVRPRVAIHVAEITRTGTIRVRGTGFGSQPPDNLGLGLGVEIDQVSAQILSWQDDLIQVAFQEAQPGQTLVVLSTFLASAQLSDSSADSVADEGPGRGRRGTTKRSSDKKGR